MASRSRFLQPALSRWIFADRARTPQAIYGRLSSNARALLHAARAPRRESRDRLLRMQMVAGSRRDRMVSPRGVPPRDRSYGPLRGSVAGGDCARTRTHQALRSFCECIPGLCRDGALLSSCDLVAEQEDSCGTRTLLR